MKKTLTALLCTIFLSVGMAVQANELSVKQDASPPPPGHCQKPPQFKDIREHQKQFEEKLKLTDAQKQAAKKNRIESRKKMKPIMQKIMEKQEAIMDINDSDISDAEKDKKIEKLQNDIKALKKQAHEIRKADKEAFEKLLTSEQKAELKKMEQAKKHHTKGPKPPQKPNHMSPRGPLN